MRDRVIARVQWDAGTDQHNVWLLQPGLSGFGHVGYFAKDGVLTFREVKQNEQVDPTFRLPGHALAGLRDALNGEALDAGVTRGHLRDAMATRDRLFGLVEKLTDGRAES